MGPGPQDRPRAHGSAFDGAHHAARRRSLLIDVGDNLRRAEGDPLRTPGFAPSRTAPGDLLARIAWALARFPEVWVFLLPGLYTALAVLSPWLRAHGHARLGSIVFALYRGWCHQLPQRTLFVADFPMAICARCFAIGAGLVLGALVAGRISDFTAAPRRVRLPFLAMCVVGGVPMFLDGFTQLLGFRESTNTLRVATGGLFGMAVAFWVVPTLYDAFDELRRNSSHV